MSMEIANRRAGALDRLDRHGLPAENSPGNEKGREDWNPPARAIPNLFCLCCRQVCKFQQRRLLSPDREVGTDFFVVGKPMPVTHHHCKGSILLAGDAISYSFDMTENSLGT